MIFFFTEGHFWNNILKSKIWGFKCSKEGITYRRGKKGEKREKKGKKGKRERERRNPSWGGEFSLFFKLSSDLQVVIKERSQRNSRNK